MNIQSQNEYSVIGPFIIKQLNKSLLKIPKFHQIFSGGNFVDGVVSTEFWANRLKLCGNCDVTQKFQTRKLGEISVFYTVSGCK